MIKLCDPIQRIDLNTHENTSLNFLSSFFLFSIKSPDEGRWVWTFEFALEYSSRIKENV